MRREFHITEVTDTPEGDIVRLDFRWIKDRGKIMDFAINVSLLEDDKSEDVYRIDTKHGYLHEQKFWISAKPKPLNMDYNTAFIEKKDEVTENFMRWVRLFKESRR